MSLPYVQVLSLVATERLTRGVSPALLPERVQEVPGWAARALEPAAVRLG
jgi:hypothetical protein